jgi:hypothetical protein
MYIKTLKIEWSFFYVLSLKPLHIMKHVTLNENEERNFELKNYDISSDAPKSKVVLTM